MRRLIGISAVLIVAMSAFLVGPGLSVARAQATPAATPVSQAVTVVASGLTNPREFTWNSVGALFVASAGNGGTTPGTPAAPPPLGPLKGGPTASVDKIVNGCPVTLAGNLPSSLDATGGVIGVASVAIIGDQLYALIEGGTAANGNPGTTNGVVRVNADGSTTMIADYTTWLQSHPPKNPPPEGFPNSGNPFSMIASGGELYVVDSLNGLIVRVTTDGAISLFADLSANHPVPTGLAVAPDGSFYVGTLTTTPFPNGEAKVFHITADGTASVVWTGLTMVTGVAVAPDGTLYASEMATGNTQQPPFIKPGTGQIVRQTGAASSEPVATGLDFPISIQFGPDGDLYVGQPAEGANAGQGEILRLSTTGGPINVGGLVAPASACAAPAATPAAVPPATPVPVASPAAPVASPAGTPMGG